MEFVHLFVVDDIFLAKLDIAKVMNAAAIEEFIVKGILLAPSA